MTLPPLPEPDGWIYDGLPGGLLEFKRGEPTTRDSLCRSSAPVYTAKQMHAFRAEGVAAERERCAKLCESLATFVHPMARQSNPNSMRYMGNQITQAEHQMALSCAAKIRSA